MTKKHCPRTTKWNKEWFAFSLSSWYLSAAANKVSAIRSRLGAVPVYMNRNISFITSGSTSSMSTRSDCDSLILCSKHAANTGDLVANIALCTYNASIFIKVCNVFETIAHFRIAAEHNNTLNQFFELLLFLLFFGSLFSNPILSNFLEVSHTKQAKGFGWKYISMFKCSVTTFFKLPQIVVFKFKTTITNTYMELLCSGYQKAIRKTMFFE